VKVSRFNKEQNDDDKTGIISKCRGESKSNDHKGGGKGARAHLREIQTEKTIDQFLGRRVEKKTIKQNPAQRIIRATLIPIGKKKRGWQELER